MQPDLFPVIKTKGYVLYTGAPIYYRRQELSDPGRDLLPNSLPRWANLVSRKTAGALRGGHRAKTRGEGRIQGW